MKVNVLNEADTNKSKSDIIVLRLTYLWSFMEAGVGGLFHFLHMPFTGFVVGGFAVIFIVLLAKYGNNKATVILKAFAVVLTVKFLLSPYSPLGAYIALCFQVLAAISLFFIFGTNRFSIFLLAIIAMMESAIQKPLISLLMTGNEFWISLADLLGNTFEINFNEIKIFGIILMVVYIGIYFIWGVILSNWAFYLFKSPRNFGFKMDDEFFAHLFVDRGNLAPILKRKINYSWAIGAAFMGMFFLIPFFADRLSWAYVFKIVSLNLIYWVIAPYMIAKQQYKFFIKNKGFIYEVMDTFPLVKKRIVLAWSLVSELKGLKKIKFFVIFSIWLNLFYE
jgi:hypothetical protein